MGNNSTSHSSSLPGAGLAKSSRRTAASAPGSRVAPPVECVAPRRPRDSNRRTALASEAVPRIYQVILLTTIADKRRARMRSRYSTPPEVTICTEGLTTLVVPAFWPFLRPDASTLLGHAQSRFPKLRGSFPSGASNGANGDATARFPQDRAASRLSGFTGRRKPTRRAIH